MAKETGPFEPAKVAEQVADFGTEEARLAEDRAAVWEDWAAQLEQLVVDIPTVGRPPRYMDECGLESNVYVGALYFEPSQIREYLRHAITTADAIAGSLRRAAVRVDERTEATVELLTPRREVSRGD